MVMREPLEWYDENTDNPPWIKALVEVRRLGLANVLFSYIKYEARNCMYGKLCGGFPPGYCP